MSKNPQNLYFVSIETSFFNLHTSLIDEKFNVNIGAYIFTTITALL